jgi:outer membrane autotransporter protein
MSKRRVTSPYRLLFPALVAGLTIAVGAQAATPVTEMSNTVEKLCPALKQAATANPASLSTAENDVLVRCGELKRAPGQSFLGLSASQLNGLSNMTSEESSVMGASSTAVSGAQNIAILGRLSVLRGKSGTTAALRPQQQTPQGVGIPSEVFAQQSTAGEGSDFAPMTVQGFGGGFSQMVDYGRWGAYLNSSFSFGNKDETAREPAFDFEALSMVAGLDHRITDTFILGLALGYARIDSELDRGGDLEKDGFGASLYGTWYMDKLYVDFLAGIAAGQYDMLRNVGYSVPAKTGGTTVVNQAFAADSDSTDVTLALGGGYAMSFGGFGLTPFVQASYLYSDIEGYTETLRDNNTAPGFGLALAVEDQEVESLATTVGVNLTRTFNASWGVLSPYLRFDWEHEYLNDSREIVARFAAVDQAFASLNRIVIPTDDPDRDFFNLGVGLSVVLPGGLQGFLDYSTLLGYDDLELHRFVVGLRWEF